MGYPVIKEVIVLAGGLGTRLSGEIGELPKAIAPVGDKPFLSYILDYLVEQEIETVVLSLGYRWEIICETFGDQYKSLNLLYAVEKQALGTGGGIRLASDKISEKNYFVLNGDTLFKTDLRSLSDFFFEHSADCAVALKKMKNVNRFGCVQLDGNRILKFEEKAPRKEAIINGGTYCIGKSTLRSFPLETAFSFERDYLEVATDKKRIFGKLYDEDFIDIGVPEDYQRFITLNQ